MKFTRRNCEEEGEVVLNIIYDNKEVKEKKTIVNRRGVAYR